MTSFLCRASLAVVCLTAVAADAQAAPLPWIVDAARARRELAAGAQLFDVRPAAAYARGHLAAAQPLRWEDLSRKNPPTARGELASVAQLTRSLRALGVRSDRTILVATDPRHGWGEDGRVVWALRSAGHAKVALVDGGVPALTRAGAKLVRGAAPTVTSSTFRVRPTTRWRIGTAAVRERLAQNKPRFVDTRELREYRGATPWGEKRGGHLPGAVHLYFKDLLGSDGRLLPRATLRARLERLGLKRSTPIVAYCTGGVRSAWLVALLVQLGYRDVKNYDGSLWQWSAQPAATHPLTTAAAGK